jgi:hypothetical protein
MLALEGSSRSEESIYEEAKMKGERKWEMERLQKKKNTFSERENTKQKKAKTGNAMHEKKGKTCNTFPQMIK